jgi:hypothetical protein
MDSNAAGLVLRRALKTRFSEMGWGSTPLLSASFRILTAIQNFTVYEKKRILLYMYH